MERQLTYLIGWLKSVISGIGLLERWKPFKPRFRVPLYLPLTFRTTGIDARLHPHPYYIEFGVELGIKLRQSRQGQVGKKWHADATYVKIEGRWCYLYRAMDKQGNLVDVYLSEQCHQTTGTVPDQLTTDKEPALYPAVKHVFGNDTKHRDVKYKNNLMEQDHRGIKSRYKVMKGFKNVFCALIFCTAFEELRQLFRMKNKTPTERRRNIPSTIQKLSEVWRVAPVIMGPDAWVAPLPV